MKLLFICNSALQAFLSRMYLTLHATRRKPQGASRLVEAMSARSVKTRRASYHTDMVGMRGANSYGSAMVLLTTAMHDTMTIISPPSPPSGHTTAAMHEMSAPLPPPPSSLPWSFIVNVAACIPVFPSSLSSCFNKRRNSEDCAQTVP